MKNLRETVEFRELGSSIVTCPICKHETLDSHWICETCGWEYDGIFDEAGYSSCNHSTVKDYKEKFQNL